MPTGYTRYIHDGMTSFPEWAMICARAFDACVTMMDKLLNSKIPEKFESSFLSLEMAIADYQKLIDLSHDDFAIIALERLALDKEVILDGINKNTHVLFLLNSMRIKVLAWSPPTINYNSLKDFMLKLLDNDIELCESNIVYYKEKYNDKMQKNINVDEIMAMMLSEARLTIALYEKEYKEKVNRRQRDVLWIKRLRDSLKTEENEGK